jgi:Spy/CpxP family protein refolding chaperone
MTSGRAALAGVVVAVASTVALTAWAHERGGPGHDMHGGPGAFGGPMGGGMGLLGGGRGLERMLDGVNATEQQRSEVRQIAEAVASDLRAQADARRALRERAMQVFTAPTVDANAAEQVRQQMLAQHDQASKRISGAMIEISRVLTPEQRAQIAERMKQRGERMREFRERMQQRQGEPAPKS